MAILVTATYSKKLGLPGFSSHAFSLCLQCELTDLNDLQSSSRELYEKLQDSVDQEIRNPGWLPNEHHDSSGQSDRDKNGSGNHSDTGRNDIAWACSYKQRNLIESISREKQLSKRYLKDLAQERFGKALEQLNKMEMSGLLDELLETYGKTSRGANGSGRSANGKARSYTASNGRRSS